MSRNNGSGDIVSINNPLFSRDSLNVGLMAAVRHGNGRDWWILVSKYDQPDIYKFLLTPIGIYEADSQSIGMHAIDYGWATFSPDGQFYSRYSYRNSFDSAASMEVFRFDRCSGELSNYQDLSFYEGGLTYNGMAVSANSRYLYRTTGEKLFQWDLLAPDISSTRIQVAEWDGFIDPQSPPNHGTGFSIPQLAPDGKIYITAGETYYLHVIENPDLPGLACNVTQHSVHLPCYQQGSPPNYPNFRLGPMVGSVCDSLGLGIRNEHPSAALRILTYPNPGSAEMVFDITSNNYHGLRSLEIYNDLGKLISIMPVSVFQSLVRHNVSKLAGGLYVAVLKSEGEVLARCKFTVVHK